MLDDLLVPNLRLVFCGTAAGTRSAAQRAYYAGSLAFNGKRAACLVLGVDRVDFGLQQSRIGDTTLFCVPSTSGLAARHWDLAPWRQLAAHVPAWATV